jgi:DNA-binding IclR family transcriptional regulator
VVVADTLQRSHGWRLVLQTVAANPGLSKSDLARRTGLAWGTIDYYVTRMCRDAAISQLVDGRRVHLFEGAATPARHLQVVCGRALTASLLQALQAGGCSSPQLAATLDVSPKTVTRHLEELERLGLVRKAGVYRPVYSLQRPEALPTVATVPVPAAPTFLVQPLAAASGSA